MDSNAKGGTEQTRSNTQLIKTEHEQEDNRGIIFESQDGARSRLFS